MTPLFDRKDPQSSSYDHQWISYYFPDSNSVLQDHLQLQGSIHHPALINMSKKYKICKVIKAESFAHLHRIVYVNLSHSS